MKAHEFDILLEGAPPGFAVLYAEDVSSLKGCQAKKSALAAYHRGDCELVRRRVSGPHPDGRDGRSILSP